MEPTNKLRFVERLEPVAPFGGYVRKVRVLQQWWINMWEDTDLEGEWRDVMTVPEDKQ